MKSLEETLMYQNEDLLIKFRDFYDLSCADRLFVFENLKKWLWIKALHVHHKLAHPTDESLQFHFHVLPSLRIVDELWHVFILFTAEYREFCEEYLGTFVDHQPSLPHKKLSPERLNLELKREFGFIGQFLGMPTLQLWFKELRDIFPESIINSKYIYLTQFRVGANSMEYI